MTHPLLALVRCASAMMALVLMVAAGCHARAEDAGAGVSQLERAIAAGDAVGVLWARRSADALVDAVDVEGSAAAAHDHQRQVSRGRGATRRWPRCAAAEETDPAQYFKRVNDERHVVEALSQAARLGVGADQEQDRRRRRGVGGARRTACRSTSPRTATAAGAGPSCAASGRSRRIARSHAVKTVQRKRQALSEGGSSAQ